MLTNIKKLLYIIILIFLFILSSCGKQENTDIKNNLNKTILKWEKMKAVWGEVYKKWTKDEISTKVKKINPPIKPNFKN